MCQNRHVSKKQTFTRQILPAAVAVVASVEMDNLSAVARHIRSSKHKKKKKKHNRNVEKINSNQMQYSENKT